MTEITLQDVYTGLSARMDTMTEELVRIRNVVDKFETYDEITVKNGNGKEYTQSRQQFLQWAYDLGKPGGDTDKKIDTMRVLLEGKIAALDPVNQEQKKDIKWDRSWKIGSRITVLVLALVFLVKFVDWNTIFDLMR